MTEKGLDELKERHIVAIRNYKDIQFEIKKLKELTEIMTKDDEYKLMELKLKEEYFKGLVDAYSESILIAKKNRGRNSRGD